MTTELYARPTGWQVGEFPDGAAIRVEHDQASGRHLGAVAVRFAGGTPPDSVDHKMALYTRAKWLHDADPAPARLAALGDALAGRRRDQDEAEEALRTAEAEFAAGDPDPARELDLAARLDRARAAAETARQEAAGHAVQQLLDGARRAAHDAAARCALAALEQLRCEAADAYRDAARAANDGAPLGDWLPRLLAAWHAVQAYGRMSHLGTAMVLRGERVPPAPGPMDVQAPAPPAYGVVNGHPPATPVLLSNAVIPGDDGADDDNAVPLPDDCVLDLPTHAPADQGPPAEPSGLLSNVSPDDDGEFTPADRSGHSVLVVQEWFFARCVLRDGVRTRASDLHEDLAAWCEARGVDAPSAKGLGGYLGLAGLERQRSDGIWWLGVELAGRNDVPEDHT